MMIYQLKYIDGLTFKDNYLLIENNQEIEGCFIGWDYAHAGDYMGYYSDKETWKNEKKWTTQEIYKEVKEVCYQLEQLKENSPADKMFEKMDYKKSKIINAHNTENIRYLRDDMYSTNVDFDTWGKMIRAYYGDREKAGHISIDVLKAINKKCEELGWI